MLITWEDKLHDKMTSAYSKSCEYKKFSVHTNTKKYRFQIVPLWRAFSKSSVFVDLFIRISVDGSRIPNNKVAFSNLSGIVWTGPNWTPPDGQFTSVDLFIKKCRVNIQKLNFNKSLKFSNLFKEEWTAHQNLKTWDDIVIKPADKGGAVVVWHTDLTNKKLLDN